MSEASVTVNADTLTVAGVLDFTSVLSVQALGHQFIQESAGPVCHLDLAAVTYSSSVGVALLLDWLRAAQALGKSLLIQNMPADMAALVGVSGLQTFLPQA